MENKGLHRTSRYVILTFHWHEYRLIQMTYFIAVLQSFPCNIKTLEIFLRVNIPIAHVHS